MTLEYGRGGGRGINLRIIIALVIAIGRDGDLESPAGMAIDTGRQRLYVADSKKHQVFCYSTADGTAVRTIGRRGSEPGEFNFPTNVSVDKEGRLYVSSWTQGKVWRIEKNGGTPTVLLEGLQSAADFYLDEAAGQLLVPDMKAGTLTLLPLKP